MPSAAERPGASEHRPHVLLWGTYDLGKPRTRILRAGLRACGVQVDECHASIWERVRDKSEIGLLGIAAGLLRSVASYPRLLARFLRAPRPDAVIVGYLGQLDVLVLAPFARWRRVPLVWDMFLSLHDTVVGDRRWLAKWNPVALALYAWEWLACRAADRVVLDTEAHAAFVASRFGLSPERVASAWVGVEEAAFPVSPPLAGARDGPARVLFYGQLIPLHGVETILAAARLLADEPIHFTLIGSGQEEARVREATARGGLADVEWIPWVPYEELGRHIAEADVCLGIFGDSGKAARVIPNKVFQIVAVGRPLVTRDSPALRELFPGPEPGLILVPPADPEALAAALRTFAGEHGTASDPRFAAARAAITTASAGRRWLELLAASRARLPAGATDAR